MTKRAKATVIFLMVVAVTAISCKLYADACVGPGQQSSNLNLCMPSDGSTEWYDDLTNNWQLLDGLFAASTGHDHTGVAGEGPKIPPSGLKCTNSPVNGYAPIYDAASLECTWTAVNGISSCTCAGAGINTALVGSGASAAASGATCMGDDANCSGINSTGVGQSAAPSAASTTAVGYGASASDTNATCLGALATCTGENSICVGKDCGVSGDDSIIMGYGSGIPLAPLNGVCLGSSLAACSGTGPVCIGKGANCTNGGMCLGEACVSDESTEFAIGSPSHTVTEMCGPKGCDATNNAAWVIHPTDLASGALADVGGGTLTLRGGISTGDQDSGAINFMYCAAGASGTTLNTSCTTYMIWDAGHLTLADNVKLKAGTAGDSSFYYDGTNLIINPKEVGTGYVGIAGTMNVNNDLYIQGTTYPVAIVASGSTSTVGVTNTGHTVTTPVQQAVSGSSWSFNVSGRSEFYTTMSSNIDLTSAPTLTAGTDGQTVWIWNVDGSETITFHDDGDSGVASNLQLGAATRVLSQNDGLCLHYQGTLGDWLECGFSNN